MPAFIRPTPRRLRCLPVMALVVTLASCAGPAEDDGATAPGATTSPSATAPSSESTSATPSKSPSRRASTQAPTGPTLKVTVKGEGVTPNAEEIVLPVGEPLTIDFSADRAGELHVHSKPEQYVQFAAGTSTQRLVITTPGTVEIEEHETGAVVAVVEVS